MNAYSTIDGWEEKDFRFVDQIFQATFGVKLLYGQHSDGDAGCDPITGIEFPSEAEATMFMLRA